MTYLPTNPDNETDGGTLELDGVIHHVYADVGGFTYVFVAGGVDDGVSVFRLNQNGTLTPVFDVSDDVNMALNGVRGLSTAMVDGNTYLFTSGQADNGVSVFRVNTNGSLTHVQQVLDTAGMHLLGVNSTATARVGASTYLFTAGQSDDGISVFRVAGDGRLTHVQSVTDTVGFALDGASDVHTVTIGATSFLIVAGNTDDGISVFSIGATGTLTHVQTILDSGALELDGAFEVTSAVVNGIVYVYVAGNLDNGITVYSMNGAGNLTHVQNLADDATMQLGGVGSLAVLSFGGHQYLSASGAEGGISLFRIGAGGTGNQLGVPGSLSFVHNIVDGGALELQGFTTVSNAMVGGTTHLIGGGFDDDGVSVFGSSMTGQLFWFGQGGAADGRLAYVNNDGLNHINFVDSTPTNDLLTQFPAEIGVDAAAGFYFAIVNGGNDGSGGRLVRGSLSGGPVTVLVDFQNGVGSMDDDIVNALVVDTINERIYVGVQDAEADAGFSGIRQYSYNPLTGAITDLGFLVTDVSSGKPTESGFAIFDPRDFDFDITTGNLFFTELLTGGVQANGLFRLNTATPNTVVQMVIQTQFPDNGSNGFIIDVEVDSFTNLVYFTTQSQAPSPDPGYNPAHIAIWYVAENATNATATQLTLIGLPGGHPFYGGDMVFDQVTRQLYVESEGDASGAGADDNSADDVIFVFQLNAAGTTATLINTIAADPAFSQDFVNIAGMHFNQIASLTGVTATGTAAVEQGLAVDLLNGAPDAADADHDHLAGATVQITGGSFNSNENSFNDDDLGYTSAMTQAGLIAGTNITISWNQATGTLTLTGYDTHANYEAVLNNIHFQSSGDNPTNYGLNTFRTITWTVNDGTFGTPGGQQNSAVTTVNITGVNDAITTNGVSPRNTNEDTPLAITGLSITDPDLNPGITDITVTLTVTGGIVTLLTNVAGGLTAADIANNGTASITITATLNEINATLAAANGMVFTNTPDYNGAASIRIEVSDGGNTGTGGPQTDDDTINITVNAVVDIAPDPTTTDEDNAVNILVFANDTFEANNEAITALVFNSAHGNLTINDNGTAGNTTDDFLVFTPTADFNGVTSITYQVTSGGVTEFTTFNVTVNAVADIADDTITAFDEDSGAVTFDPLANDSFENAARFISSVTQPAAGGVVTIIDGPDADGIMDYILFTQTADYNGSGSFTYTVTSGGVTETATINFTINAVADIADDNVTVDEDSGANTLNLYANDSFENPGRSITAVTQGANGTVAINNNGTGGDTSDDFVTYTPTANFHGTDTFTYTVTSGGVTEVATVNVTVTAVNDPVTGTAPASLLLNEDDSNVAVTGLSISDVDTVLSPAGVYDVTLSATNGTLTLTTTTGLTFGTGDGAGDTTMTFHGTLADINAALATATYTPDANFNGAATITLEVTDTFGGVVATGTGAATSDTDVVNVTVTAINDTPVVTVATPLAVDEQVAEAIAPAGTLADIDLDARNGGNGDYGGSVLTVSRNGGATAQDVLSIVNGAGFTVNGSNLEAGGLVFATVSGGNGTPLVITFTSSGTPATSALADAVLQAIQYVYTGDTPPASIVLDLSLNDGAPANAGQGGGGSPTGATSMLVNITDTPENAPPTLDLDADDSNTVGTGYTAAFTEGGAAVLIADTDVSITDADSGGGDMIEGATIAINGPVAGDQLVLGPQGGFVVTGSGTGTITITGTGTAAQYEAMLELITFTNGTDDPGASRTINVTVTDGTDTSNVAVATINITEINDEPTLTATGGTPTFTEGGAAVDLFSGVTVSTVEAGQTISAMTLTVTNVGNPGSEVLVIDGSDVAINNGNAVVTAGNGLLVNVSVTGSTATLSFSGAALSAATVAAIIDAMTYRNLSDNPTDADRVITITQLVDSGSNTPPNDNTAALAVAATVNVDPVNDAPVNTVPGTQTINEDASVTLSTANGNAISVADLDAAQVSVTLSALHGTLTLASTASLAFGAGDGTNDTTMTFTGTAAAINAALGAGLTYAPNADFNGSDTITVFTTDNGQTGGAAQTDTDNITVNITAINDAPVVAGDGTEDAADINEDTPGAGQTIQALFSGQYSDAADNQIPNGGASSPGQFSGIAITANGSNPAEGQWQYYNGAIWVDIGPASDGAAVLLGDPFTTLLRFNPALDFTGDAPTLTVHLIDNSLGFGITNGQVVDLSGMGATGGATAYSAGTVVLSQFVIPDNLAPVVDLNGGDAGIDYATSYTEDGSAVAIGAGVLVFDQDLVPDGMLVGATITLTDRVAGDMLVLTMALPGGFGVVFTNSAGSITIEITGTGTGAQYQALIESILYSTTSQDPDAGGTDLARTIEVTVDDGVSVSAVATTIVNITAVDDAAAAQPDAYVIAENGSITGGNLFADNGSGADSDPDGPALAISAVNGSGANVGSQFMLASGALLTVNVNGTFDYDPNGAFLSTPTPGSGASNTPGQDSFSYTLAGGNTATVTISLTGLDTDDILLGTAGSDVLTGGNGNDIYYVENGADQVIELNGGGNDRVIASVSYVLGASTSVETLQAAVGLSPINLTGNGLANTLIGNDGANVLHGGGGVGDVLSGLGGNDLYYTDVASTQIVEVAGGGTDTLYTSVSYVLGGNAQVENLSTNSHAATSAINLTGNHFAQAIFGNAGANIINGGGGADQLVGFGGNDTYYVDLASVKVYENAGGGNDTVYTSVSYALLAGQEIELLSTNSHAATSAINLTGNNFAQAIFGNAGANIINGGGGADQLIGFGGNDTYYVDLASVKVYEDAGGGNDAVYTSVSYALLAGQQIEFLSANSHAATSAINLTGNELANTLYGNAGANVLDGKGGSDALVGLAGADTFAFTTALGAGNVDIVFGFEHGVDRIALDDAIFTALGAPGALDPNAFVTGSAAADADDRIIYNSLTGQLFYDADGNGAGAAVQFATMSPGLTITASDFMVI